MEIWKKEHQMPSKLPGARGGRLREDQIGKKESREEVERAVYVNTVVKWKMTTATSERP